MADSSKMACRVLHTSDLHLELVNDKACRSLEAIVALTLKAKVDLVIIAGDFFEHNRVSDNLVRFAVEQLRRLPGCVAILPGNHDCLVPDTVYDRVALWQDATNVRVFRAPEGETLTFPEARVSVWGKALESYASDLRPLAGIPPAEGNGQWHIAVAHGCYVGVEPPYFQSLCITEEEIVASSGWHYIALGHLPVFSYVCSEPVKAYYCDSPSLMGTVNMVDLSEEVGVQVSRRSL